MQFQIFKKVLMIQIWIALYNQIRWEGCLDLKTRNGKWTLISECDCIITGK